jgi:HTH-type transcriptional regulator/antitoxin HigA
MERRIMKTRNEITPFRALPRTFDGLCKMLPLRPVHDDVDLANASEVIEALAGHQLNQDQQDYLEALSNLVGAYEDVRFEKDLGKVTPLKALRYLVEHNGLTASGLGEILGNRALGSKILRGEREMSKTHIRKLAKRFNVSPALFV